MMKKLSPTLLLIFYAWISHAQNSQRLTLQQAFSLAVNRSKQLAISRASLELAQSKLAQAKDKAWPEVKASVNYLRINTPTVDLKTADNSGGGGSSGGNSNPLAAAFSNLHDIALAQVSVSQPVFSGFRIHNTKLMQQYLTEAARYDTATAKSKVLLNTARALYQFYELQQTRKLIDQNLKQAQQRVSEFKNLEAQSLLPRNDRLKAELQANNIELTRTEVDNNLAMAQFNLNILLGLPDDAAIELDTTDLFTDHNLSTWEDFLQKGLENRSELKAASYQVKASETGIQIAKASRYPSLALSAGYVNAYIPNVLTVTNALNGGLAFQYNLTGILHSKHLIREAKAQQRQAELSQQIMNDNIRAEIKKDFLDYQKAQQKIRLSQEAIAQAQENYSISKNKYDAGLIILSDYLEADVILLQTKINLETARAESMIAYYELAESTGSIQ
jgi:outer membrane protein